MKKKKILFYTMTMNYGGTERIISNLSNYFIKKYDIILVSNIKSKCAFTLDSKIKYITLDRNDKSKENFVKKIFTKLSSYRTKKLDKIIEKEKPDLIISFLPEPSIRALKLKKKYNIPTIVAIRNDPNHEFNFPFLKIIRNHYYKMANKIIVQHKNFINCFPGNFKDKFITIPNMIDIKVQKEKVKKDIIINVGRLVKQKNHKLLIKAFNNFSDNYKNYKLIIYGEGKLRNKLEKQIKRLKLEDRVFIKNNTNKILEKVSEAKLFVLSSNYEGMPNALLEAISVGTCSVSTNCSYSIKNIIKNKNYICKKNDYKALCKIMEYALSKEDIPKINIDNNKIYNMWDELFKN